MYLDELIERLERADQTRVVPIGFANPHSYRGVYAHLAFEPARDVTVASMLACARGALGQTFTGYKGGEYEMGPYTPVILAEHGSCGEEIGPMFLSLMLGVAQR